MAEHVFALLIHDQPELFQPLRRALRELAVDTYSVSTCQEAGELISQCRPHIIFTEVRLQDGSWVSVLNRAEAAEVPPSVIVVAPLPEIRLYLSIMDRGAFDFVAPPFDPESLKFIVDSAAQHVHRHREALAMAAMA